MRAVPLRGKSMKVNEEIELRIDSFGSNAEGVGKKDETVCFVPYALPGETVRVKIRHVKGTVAYADLQKVLIPSKHRVTPVCPKFGKCGGCVLQHADRTLQAEFKRALVEKNFAKIAGLNVDVPPVITGEKDYGYRNKLQMPFGKVGKRTVCGFYRTDSHELVSLKDCPLQEGWAKDLIECVTTWANRYQVPVYSEKTQSGILRHLVVRAAAGQIVVTLVINASAVPYEDELWAALRSRFDRIGLYLNENRRRDNVILGEKSVWRKGIAAIEREEFGIRYEMHPDGFYQVNDEIKNKIYQKAKDLLRLQEADFVVDAFSGGGVLSALMYGDYDLYGIEIVPEAVKDAEILKRKNGLTRWTNLCGDVKTELPRLLKEKAGNGVLIVDPPRKGLHPETAQFLCQSQIGQIVYISCDSATLARDVKILSDAYEITYLQPYDMFPQTKHVETLVCLSKK